MVSQIYPSELQLNNANTSDTEGGIIGFIKFFVLAFVCFKETKSATMNIFRNFLFCF